MKGCELKRITLSLIALACAIVAPHLACAQQTCPPTLKVEQKAVSPGADWSVTYSGYDTALAGVTVFDGPPANQASLAPDREHMTHDAVFQTWKLAKNATGYWLECEYANTTAQISRRLELELQVGLIEPETALRFTTRRVCSYPGTSRALQRSRRPRLLARREARASRPVLAATRSALPGCRSARQS